MRKLLVLLLIVTGCQSASDKIPTEKDGLIMVEAESFVNQSKDDVRRWYLADMNQAPEVLPDGDGNHSATASNQSYLEILPDTRVTHADSLVAGINFSPESGVMAVLDYKINFTTTGRYYVWVRAYSSGAEDNSIHVGMG